MSYPSNKVIVIFSNCAAVNDLWSHLIGNWLQTGMSNKLKKGEVQLYWIWVYLAILTNWMSVIIKNAIPKPILHRVLLCVWLRHQEYFAWSYWLICSSVPMFCSSIEQMFGSAVIFTMASSSIHIFIEHIRQHRMNW